KILKQVSRMENKEETVYTYLEGEKLPNLTSLSGIEHKEFYDKSDWNDTPPEPGKYPYTGGIHREFN
ncbi:MAG: hypothetical protein ABSC57_10265, partial [Syntrophales bacterium]